MFCFQPPVVCLFRSTYFYHHLISTNFTYFSCYCHYLISFVIEYFYIPQYFTIDIDFWNIVLFFLCMLPFFLLWWEYWLLPAWGLRSIETITDFCCCFCFLLKFSSPLYAFSVCFFFGITATQKKVFRLNLSAVITSMKSKQLASVLSKPAHSGHLEILFPFS